MSDLQKLAALALAAKQKSGSAPWAYEPHGDTGEFGVGVLEDEHGMPVTGSQDSGEMLVLEPVAAGVSCEAYAAFIAAANPAAVLGLIADAGRSEKHRNDQQDTIVAQATETAALKAALEHEQARVTDYIAQRAQSDRNCDALKAECEGLRRRAEFWRSPEDMPADGTPAVVLRDAQFVGNPAHPGNRSGRWLELSVSIGRMFACDAISTGTVIGWVPVTEFTTIAELRKDAERLEKATAYVQKMCDAAGEQPSVATGYLHDILSVMSKEASNG